MTRSGWTAKLAACSAVWLGLASTTVLADDTPAPATERLTAAAAWAKVVGNTIVGATPDGSYTEFFAADGSLAHLDQDGKIGGRWVLRDAQVCLVLPDEDDDDCRAVEVMGNAGAFVDRDGNHYPFEILPGNAKSL